MNDAALRRIWLCADDYGLAEGVNRAIRDLISRGRLNATSVMVVGAAIGRAEVAALQEAAANSPRCAIGLHATLTAPFRPLTMHFRPTDGGLFLPFPNLLRSGLLRRLDPEMIEDEASGPARGLQGAVRPRARFHRRPPACATVPAGARRLPARGEGSRPRRLGPPGRTPQAAGRAARRAQGAVLDVLSAQFRKRAARAGIAFNPAFAGAYDFSKAPDFGVLMGEFLAGLPEGGLVMCHPGFVDETLESLDPLTTQREAEHAYLASDRFPALLAANKVTLG